MRCDPMFVLSGTRSGKCSCFRARAPTIASPKEFLTSTGASCFRARLGPSTRAFRHREPTESLCGRGRSAFRRPRAFGHGEDTMDLSTIPSALVVDDDAMILMDACAILERAGSRMVPPSDCSGVKCDWSTSAFRQLGLLLRMATTGRRRRSLVDAESVSFAS